MMRRNFKKMLTVALAAAMVVTAVPMQPAQAAEVTLAAAKKAKKTVVVTTQKELDAALKAGTAKKIKIKTDAKVNFKIKKGEYKNLKVVVDAPNAKIKNNASGLKKIKVDSLAKWTEKAEGNKFVVAATESKIVVGKNAVVEAVSYKTEGAKVELKVQGSVAKVVVEKALEMVVSGKAESVAIEVAKTAEGATITATVTVKVETEADVKVELGEGAEGSKVETTDTTVDVEVKNETKEEVTVTTPEGEQKVEAGTTGTTEGSTGDNTGDNKEDNKDNNTGGGSTGGGAGGSGGGAGGGSSTGGAGGGSGNGGSTGGDNNGSSGDESEDQATPAITAVYENGNTTYTLTGATLEELKSVTVTAKVKKSNGEFAGREDINVPIETVLFQWLTTAENCAKDPKTAEAKWAKVTEKPYKYGERTMTFTGKGATKTVTVTEGKTSYTAEVTASFGTNTVFTITNLASNGTVVVSEKVVVTVIDTNTLKVVRGTGAEHTITRTATSLTISGIDTTNANGRFYLEITNPVKK